MSTTSTCDLTDLFGISVKICDAKTDEEIIESYMPKMFYEDKKGVKHLDENTFAEAFSEVNNLRYNNGLFYTRNGKTTEELLARDVWLSLKQIGVNKDVERTTKKLVGAIKLASTVPALTTNPSIIPFANGDLYTDKWHFQANEYTPSAYRLPVELPLVAPPTPCFTKWMKDLFEKEDIPTLQEYMGYALVASTKAQKALFLVGEGGAGKSVLGVLLSSILGEAMMSTPSTHDFLQDKFKIPELENKLVLYDDDLDDSALSGTGFYKKLITNTISITADRKYGQPFTFTPCVKLISCCNKMLTSSRDFTEGFYRRLLPIVIKPISDTFVPDPQFYDKIKKEAAGVAMWSLMGLRRLINNTWNLSVSERSKRYIQAKKTIENHFPEFMYNAFDFGSDYQTPMYDIMAVYSQWCHKNSYDPQKSRVLQMWIADNADRYKITNSQNIKTHGKYVRGYTGLRISPDWSGVTSETNSGLKLENGTISLINYS